MNELDKSAKQQLKEAAGDRIEDTRWVIRFDAADGSSIIVQPNDVDTIDRLCQDESLTVRARLTVRQYKWREEEGRSLPRLFDRCGGSHGGDPGLEDPRPATGALCAAAALIENDRLNPRKSASTATRSVTNRNGTGYTSSRSVQV
mgnify:CR=1 FL=1